MSKRRRNGSRPAENGFWGEDVAPEGHPAAGPIRPTPDPAALPRSLGDPPLPVRAGVAEAHLAAVYEEAVRAATALAAVNGLLADSAADAEL